MRSEDEIRALSALAKTYREIFTETKTIDYLDGSIKTMNWVLEE